MFADMTNIPADIYDVLQLIRTDLKDEGIRPSDRRFRQSLSILKAKAVLEGRSDVEVEDILILKDGLWETVDQKGKVHEIVTKHSQDVTKTKLIEIEAAAKEIYERVKTEQSSDIGLEATSKMKSLLKELAQLASSTPNKQAEIQAVRTKVEASKINCRDFRNSS